MATPFEPKKSYTRRMLAEYTKNSSIHGLQYLNNSHQHWLDKIWWCIACFGSFFACGYLNYQVYQQWQLNPVEMGFAPSIGHLWQIPFPTVTICPLRKIRNATFDFDAAARCAGEHNAGLDCPLGDEQLATMDAMTWICPADRMQSYERNRSQDDVFKLIRETGQRQADYLEYCFVKGEHFELCADVFNEQMTSDGICTSSNMLTHAETFRDGVHTDFDHIAQHNRKQNNWDIDTGYTVRPDQDIAERTNPWRVIGGMRYQFNSFLIALANDAGPNDGCLAENPGYIVTVRPPHEYWPASPARSQIVPAMGITQLTIVPHVVESDPSIRRYSPENRQCYFRDEKRLRFFRQYTRGNCELECAANVTLRECKCVAFFAPRSQSTPVCSIDQQNCVRRIHNVLSRGAAQFTRNDPCNCLRSCNEIEYKLRNPVPMPLQFFQQGQDGAGVAISFESNEFETRRLVELYGPLGFLASCGGFLGLFLGMSLLSVAEFVYFFSIRLMFNLWRK